jgi:metal-dependent amidase/aminoacylase/carboxypeptidase family protein
VKFIVSSSGFWERVPGMSDLNPNIAIGQGMAIYPDLRRIRRKLHCFPETGFELERTVALIGSWLESIGVPFQTGIGRSGIVALIQGDRPGPVVGLRADMDALPILVDA